MTRVAAQRLWLAMFSIALSVAVASFDAGILGTIIVSESIIPEDTGRIEDLIFSSVGMTLVILMRLLASRAVGTCRIHLNAAEIASNPSTQGTPLAPEILLLH